MDNNMLLNILRPDTLARIIVEAETDDQDSRITDYLFKVLRENLGLTEACEAIASAAKAEDA